MNKIKRTINYLYLAGKNTVDHDGMEHAGYMSFMVLMSIFPFLVFFLVLTNILGMSSLGEYFLKILIDNLPQNTTGALKIRMTELSKTPPQSLMTLAIVGSIWTISSFVESVRTILNKVYQLDKMPHFLLRRILSILQFFIISISLFFTMLILVFVPIILDKIVEIQEIMSNLSIFWSFLKHFLIFASLFAVVTFLYYVVPNVRIKIIEVIPGALLTVILWIINAYLLSEYIVYYQQLSLIYGSLGSIIMTLIFFYIVNLIFIYGAELNFIIFKR